VLAYMKINAKVGVKKMWGKMLDSTLPAGTVIRKTITGVEKHGTCRFQCFKDKMCGGYAFVMASHECKLLSAPNFLAGKAGNDNWHMLASHTTGVDYKADEMEEENKAMNKAKGDMPKVKSQKVPPKTDDLAGHLPMNLQGVMNKELSKLEDKTEETGLTKAADKVYERYRSKLFQEYYQSYAHEYEIQAESKAEKDAKKIVDDKVKKMNRESPDNKVSKDETTKIYIQARKEVDNHAVRKYQRKFMKDLAEFATKKLYIEQEGLKQKEDQRAQAQKEVDLQNEKMINEAKANEKEPPALVKLPDDPDAADEPKEETAAKEGETATKEGETATKEGEKVEDAKPEEASTDEKKEEPSTW